MLFFLSTDDAICIFLLVKISKLAFIRVIRHNTQLVQRAFVFKSAHSPIQPLQQAVFASKNAIACCFFLPKISTFEQKLSTLIQPA